MGSSLLAQSQISRILVFPHGSWAANRCAHASVFPEPRRPPSSIVPSIRLPDMLFFSQHRVSHSPCLPSRVLARESLSARKSSSWIGEISMYRVPGSRVHFVFSTHVRRHRSAAQTGAPQCARTKLDHLRCGPHMVLLLAPVRVQPRVASGSVGHYVCNSFTPRHVDHRSA